MTTEPSDPYSDEADEEDRPITLTPEEVEDLVDLWHDGAGRGLPLYQFLGWTASQYAAYVQSGVIPPQLFIEMEKP